MIMYVRNLGIARERQRQRKRVAAKPRGQTDWGGACIPSSIPPMTSLRSSFFTSIHPIRSMVSGQGSGDF
jgi:hypothetical protein